MPRTIFDLLFEVLQDRRRNPSDSSYVAGLYQSGVKAINAKIIEEAKELTEAAEKDDPHRHLIHEVCDLLFHIFVLCGHRDIGFEEIEAELKRRYGISGLVEKKEREKKAR